VTPGVGVGIPEGLRDVVGRRLNRLGGRANQVLSIAAVIGRDFRLDVLQKVASVSEDDVLSALEEAQERSIIEQQHIVGTVGFRFTHAFFRQTLYEEIFAPRRIRWHQQVGRALEEVYSRRLEDHAAELAEHFSQSTEVDDLDKAVVYAEMASQRAQAVFDYGEAVRRLEQALKALGVLDPADESRRCDLLLALIRPLAMSGEPTRAAQEVAEEAFQIADRIRDDERALRAVRLADQAISRYSRNLPFAGRSTWATRGDRLAKPGSVDRVYADIALAYTRPGPESTAIRLQAFELARELGDREALFRAGLFAVAGAVTGVADVGDPTALAYEALAWPREGVASYLVGEVLWHCSDILYQEGNVEESRRIDESVKALGERANDRDLTFISACLDARWLYHIGRVEEALNATVELMRLAHERDSPFLEGTAIWLSVAPAVQLGRVAETLGSVKITDLGVRGAITQALVDAHCGRQVRDLDHALDPNFEFGPAMRGVLIALQAATVLWDVGWTRTFLPTVEGLAGTLNGFVQTSSDRVLAEAHLVLGQVTEARARLNDGLEVCEKVRFRPEVALIRLDLAELLLDHYLDEHNAAIEHLDFAIAELRDMKMQPALERALGRRGLLKA
jgi:tetratricopeptide (TPR) repeat protein